MKPDLILVSSKSEHIMRVCDFLNNAQINVLCIENAQEAKAGLAVHSPAFALLDFDIKGSDFLLSEIAYSNLTPFSYIIVASTFIDSGERTAMFRRGADACVEKPINSEEVLAIIRAVQRHRQRNTQTLSSTRSPHTIEYNELIIDSSQRLVTMRGKSIALTRKEFDVLHFLASHMGTVLTKNEIYSAVWKANYDPKSTNVSDQISSLRHKLGLTCKDKNYIQTVVGVGYRFGKSI